MTENNPHPIYLDNHATTPVDPRVLEAMLPCYKEVFGNPSSSQHAHGQAASKLVETARRQVANLLGVDPREILFTSGATESINLALKGVLSSEENQAGHLITTEIEHKAVLDVAQHFERTGGQVTYLPLGLDGVLKPEQVLDAITSSTKLVSLQYANNEIGTIQPIPEVAKICRERGILLHCDAAQGLPYLDCRIATLGADLLSISSHKSYGPKGIGALFARRKQPRVRLEPQIEGGGQERGLRSGTLNVPGIVGLGKACELLTTECQADGVRISALRDRLLAHLEEKLPGLVLNGSRENRLPNNINVSLPGVSATKWLAGLSKVSCSAGSACSNPSSGDGSYVVQGLGKFQSGITVEEARTRAQGSIRLGLGRFTTEEEVEFAQKDIVDTAVFLLSRLNSQDSSEEECSI